MYLTNLHLRQFRNYERMELSFDHHVNVFLGDNAQGKTNLLEAIYVLALAKSHRTSKDQELIGWGEEFARIEGNVSKKIGDVQMELIISSKGKKGKVNGLEKQKLSEYIGAYNVVMFAPEDLSLVKGSPSVRRRFLDMELGQMSRVYLHYLSEYNKILRQRNYLLRDLRKSGGPHTMLDVLTEQLIMSAAEVTSRRFQFVRRLKKWAKDIHYEISRGKEQLTIRYLPSVHVSEEMNMSKIKEVFFNFFIKERAREIERGMTLFGPQRDDIGLFVNERDIQKYGSQGQQRTTALALKLAEVELIRDEVGEYPILLLDDVLSELDTFRQSHLLQTIKDRVQTFITTTSVESIDHTMLQDATIFNVVQGTISK